MFIPSTYSTETEKKIYYFAIQGAMESKKENLRNCITVNDEKFNQFRSNLSSFYEKIRTSEKPHDFKENDVKRLKEIINELELQRDFFIYALEDSGEIEKKLNVFYNDFVHLFRGKRKVMNYIKKEMNSCPRSDRNNEAEEDCSNKKTYEEYFYLKKMYQLSHYFGILYRKEWCEKFNSNNCSSSNPFDHFENLRNYLLLYYFMDFYESFSKFLSPFLKRIWISMSGHMWWGNYNPEEIYALWQEHWEFRNREEDRYNIKTINENREFYRDLRNVIAHATITLKGTEIKIKINKKGATKSEKNLQERLEKEGLDVHISKIKNFLYVAIVFTTEFDIRMLKFLEESIEKRDHQAYSVYREYFEVYWNAWNELA